MNRNPATTATDHSDVEAVARDYIEGWYAGDAERMERSLHDHLVKRILAEDATGPDDELRSVPKTRMVELTAEGVGTNPEAAPKVIVDAVSETIATARVYSPAYVDFLQLIKTARGWKIVNIVFHNLT